MESIETKYIYEFQTPIVPSIKEVGGKGYSLIKLTRAGLNVPPGFVLSVSYFQGWIDQLKSSDEWHNFISSISEDNKIKHLNNLKNLCNTLQFTLQQELVLKMAIKHLKEDHSIFAVRSSSPEEDLEGASFAGGYETVLGVKESTLKESIKKCFASCLDFRVYKYKLEKCKSN
jgi:phosphoenolpyruvate synthase/pyruvate phosphate dikinase